MNTATKQMIIVVSINVLLASLLIGAISTKTAKASSPDDLFPVEYYYYGSVIDNYPYGRLNFEGAAFKLLYDESSTYDWYFYISYPLSTGMMINSEPGMSLWPGQSDWHTADHGEVFYVYSPSENRQMAGWGPTNTNGWDSATETASVSFTGGTGGIGSSSGFSFSYSYSIPYIRVDDYSSLSMDRAGWVHDFNEQSHPSGPASHSHLVNPTFVVRTTQDSWSLIDSQFKALWGHPVYWWWEWHEVWSSWYYMDACYYGDE